MNLSPPGRPTAETNHLLPPLPLFPGITESSSVKLQPRKLSLLPPLPLTGPLHHNSYPDNVAHQGNYGRHHKMLIPRPLHQ